MTPTGDEMAERGTDRWIKAHYLTAEAYRRWRQYDVETVDEILSAPTDPDYFGLPLHLALMAKEQHDQLGESLGIIKDLADLHDSYIGYLAVHNNYNEAAARAIGKRIDVLRLKQ